MRTRLFAFRKPDKERLKSFMTSPPSSVECGTLIFHFLREKKIVFAFIGRKSLRMQLVSSCGGPCNMTISELCSVFAFLYLLFHVLQIVHQARDKTQQPGRCGTARSRVENQVLQIGDHQAEWKIQGMKPKIAV